MTSSDSLSQQEIDLLFGGAQAAEPVRVGPRTPAGDIQVYDFRRPSRISKDRQRTLEGMYGRLTKALESWLVSRVRSQVEVQLLAVEQFTFGEFLLSLMTPCNAFIFNIEDSGGHQGVVDFGRDLSFYLVDRLLGGNSSIVIQDRALTPLERRVIRIVTDMVLAEITEAWEDHVPLELEMARFETVPDMIQITNREDPVLVANVEVSAEHFRSNILICLPFVVLESFFTGPGRRRITMPGGGDAERAVDRRSAEISVRTVDVELSARFPTVPLTVRELIALKPGSLLATGIPVGSNFELYIEGTPRFTVAAGRSGNALAVRIKEAIRGKGDIVGAAEDAVKRTEQEQDR